MAEQHDIAIEKAHLAAVQANLQDIGVDVDETETPLPYAPVNPSGQVGVLEVAAEPTDSKTALSDEQQAGPVAEAVTVATLQTALETPPYKAAGSLFAPAVYAGDFAGNDVGKPYFALEAQEDSWLRLVAEDGTEIWAGVLRAGETYRPKAKGPLMLSTSNAGGVMLHLDGKHGQLLGDRGAVVTKMQIEQPAQLSTFNQRSSLPEGS